MIIGTDADISPFTIRHLLASGIDKVLIDLVPAEDNTSALIHDLQSEFPSNIQIIESDSIYIWGSRRMTALANLAYEQGAELVIPCDSDELFYGLGDRNLGDEIRDAQGWVWGVKVFMHLSSVEDNQDELNPYKKMVMKQTTPLALNKIIVRFNPKMVIEEGNHGARLLNGNRIPGDYIAAEMRHFPYRSPEQFVSKVKVTAKAMDATPGYPQDWGVHYRMYNETLKRAGEDALKDWFNRWFCLGTTVSEPQDFINDPAPYKGD